MFVGRPISLAIDRNSGDAYVGDLFTGRIIRYDGSGRIRGRYGDRAEPGRLKNLLSVALVGRRVVGIDIGDHALKTFDRESGHFSGAHTFEPMMVSTFVAAGDSALTVGEHDHRHGRAVLTWDPATDSMQHRLPFPAEYANLHNTRVFVGLPVLRRADTVIVGFGALNAIVRYTRAGTVLDTFVIPVRARRGTHRAILADQHAAYDVMVNAESELVGMQWLSGDRLTLVYYENHVPPGTTEISGTSVYLSILDLKARTACVDGAVPVDVDGQPAVQIAGDTLFTVEPAVRNGAPANYLNKYVFDISGCKWLAVGTAPLVGP